VKLRRLAACVSLIGCMLSGAANARDVRTDPALPTSPADSKFPVEIVRIDIGFSDDSVMRGRFVPVRVWLSSRDQSREVTIRVTSLHDDTQDGVVTLAGATTPGVVTTHDLGVYLGSWGTEFIDVSIETEGRVVHRRFSPQTQFVDAPLPPDGSQEVQVLDVGQVPSLGRALMPLPGAQAQPPTPVQTAKPGEKNAPPTPDPLALVHQAQHLQVSPTRLPSLPIVYDCVDLVAITADSLASAEPRSRDALLQWVRGGGRMLLVAETPGSAWTLPWGDAAHAPISLFDLQPLKSGTATLRQLSLPDSSSFSVNARSVTLQGDASVRGWSTRFGMNFAPTDGANRAAATSLMAFGPYGSGLLAVLTIDPSKLGPTLDVAHAKVVYAKCFEDLVPTERIESVVLSNTTPPFWGFASSRQSAVSTVLEQDAGDVPSVSFWPLALIAATTIGLGVLIGPIDALMTRRRSVRGSTTWWTAMGWIAAASVIGLVIPSLSRSGESRLNHASIIDAFCEPDGTPGREWHSDFFSLYADTPMRTGIRGLAPGSWMHGVSSYDGYGSGGNRLSTLQLPIATSDANLVQSIPRDVAESQWTLRTLHGSGGERASTWAVRAEPPTDTPKFRLTGIPAGALARSEAQLLTTFGVFHAAINAQGLITVDEAILPTDPRLSRAGNAWEEGQNLRQPGRLSRIADLLPGSSERSGAHEALRRSTRTHWCTLVAIVDGLPGECTLDGVAAGSQKGTHVARLRLSFPIDEATSESLRRLAFKAFTGTPQKGTP
jgi:hypothetical protein